MRHSISYLPFYRVKIPHNGIQFAKPDKWLEAIYPVKLFLENERSWFNRGNQLNEPNEQLINLIN